MPFVRKKSFQDVFEDASESALDLLEQLLVKFYITFNKIACFFSNVFRSSVQKKEFHLKQHFHIHILMISQKEKWCFQETSKSLITLLKTSNTM